MCHFFYVGLSIVSVLSDGCLLIKLFHICKDILSIKAHNGHLKKGAIPTDINKAKSMVCEILYR